MIVSAQHIAYLAAAMLFILSLRGLSTQETARRGNAFGIIGMALALLVTCYALFMTPKEGIAALGESTGILGGALVVGGIVGALLAARVAMTSMPELVAILHSFVGAAAVLVGISLVGIEGIVLAIAAGSFLYIALFELLPDVVREGTRLPALVALVVGIAAIAMCSA